MEGNMGVVTTADERLDSAKEHLKAAGMDLAAIVIDECWGYDDYKLDYQIAMRDALNTVIQLKGKLQG
jgi:hypothetical protein